MPNRKYLGGKWVAVIGAVVLGTLLYMAISFCPPKQAFGGGGGGGGFAIAPVSVHPFNPPTKPIAGLWNDILCLIYGDGAGALGCFNDPGFGGGGGGGFVVKSRHADKQKVRAIKVALKNRRLLRQL